MCVLVSVYELQTVDGSMLVPISKSLAVKFSPVCNLLKLYEQFLKTFKQSFLQKMNVVQDELISTI